LHKNISTERTAQKGQQKRISWKIMRGWTATRSVHMDSMHACSGRPCGLCHPFITGHQCFWHGYAQCQGTETGKTGEMGKGKDGPCCKSRCIIGSPIRVLFSSGDPSLIPYKAPAHAARRQQTQHAESACALCK